MDIRDFMLVAGYIVMSVGVITQIIRIGRRHWSVADISMIEVGIRATCCIMVWTKMITIDDVAVVIGINIITITLVSYGLLVAALKWRSRHKTGID